MSLSDSMPLEQGTAEPRGGGSAGGGGGLGFRMLSGSTFGNTLHIWSGLFSAAILAGSLIAIIGVIQRIVLKRMALET